MLMTAYEGDWLMSMQDAEDTAPREQVRQPATGKGKDVKCEEEVRALQNIARRMDTLMLGWMRKAHSKKEDDQ